MSRYPCNYMDYGTGDH